jgi:hypothetical protein
MVLGDHHVDRLLSIFKIELKVLALLGTR